VLTSEDESESEAENEDDDAVDAANEPGAVDEDALEEMKWELNKVLPEVSDAFEGLGQPCVRIEPTTSAMFCFELVFPKSVRAMIVLETNRYGRYLTVIKNRQSAVPKVWKELDDAELCVFLGLVVVSCHDVHVIRCVCLHCALRPPFIGEDYCPSA
jgi:hypothetical protein